MLAWDLTSHELLARGIINAKRGPAPTVRKAATSSLFPQNQCARALELSPDGHHLAMGTNDGSLTILNSETLAPIKLINLNSYGQRKVVGQEGNWIASMAYSPSGHLLAVGTHGSVIVLLAPAQNYKVVASITSHHSYITAMDWSTDGEILRSNCGAYELLFHAVDSDSGAARQITSATSVRDTEWASQHCPISWASLGVIREYDGSFTNAVDRSPDGSLLAAAQDDGRVALYRYPAAEKGATSFQFQGHSSHVTLARFTADGHRLLSTGGHDLALFSWTVGEYDPSKEGKTHRVDS